MRKINGAETPHTDVLVVWKLDRLGRTLTHRVNTVPDLSDQGIGLRVLSGQGAEIDTTTSAGRMIFGIFATLAELERDLIRERTTEGLAAARARGRKGGRKFALTKAQVRLVQAAMANRDTSLFRWPAPIEWSGFSLSALRVLALRFGWPAKRVRVAKPATG
jgi:DNA invertase Pin-like site-specific DNA recombinase